MRCEGPRQKVSEEDIPIVTTTPWNQIGLEEWLAHLDDEPPSVPTYCFPNEGVLNAYLASIPTRSEVQVRDLLRNHFLIRTGTLGSDELTRESWERIEITDPETWERLAQLEFTQRLLGHQREPPWQGITWVLDLLPAAPLLAVRVIEAYLIAHVMVLPDGRISGLSDAQAVIRAMWIGNPSSSEAKQSVLFELGPALFEHVIEALYHEMGFDTRLTPPRGDGGRDVEITHVAPGRKERSIVECKLWKSRVGIRRVRELLGVLAHENATKATLVCTSSFTRGAKKFADADARLELIGWPELLPLLDEHLGTDWGLRVDSHVTASVRRCGIA